MPDKNEIVKAENNLPAIDTVSLDTESYELINRMIASVDEHEVQDLTHLFNINQNKKTIVRMDALNNLQNKLAALATDRIVNHPDEVTTTEILKGLQVIQDILERNQKQITGQSDPAPLIQINQQSVNVDTQSKESREKVMAAVGNILKGLNIDQSAGYQPPIISTEGYDDDK